MTPLIDLTFLLLIIFMITAPLLEYGIDVSPPEMDAAPIADEESVVVNLNNRGEFTLEGVPMAPDSITARLAEIKQAKGKLTVMVRADGGRPYREVIELMKAVKAAGITDVSLITQAER
jgi:biopolymer transport protein ExbD